MASHGDIEALDSIERTAMEVEGHDVDAGEYILFCTEDGERLEPKLLDSVRVQLIPTGESAEEELLRLPAAHAARNNINSDPSRPQAVASELLAGKRR